MENKICNIGALGREYNPKLHTQGASKMMRKLIEETPGLKDALEEIGWNGRTVTPKIRKVIYEYIGEP